MVLVAYGSLSSSSFLRIYNNAETKSITSSFFSFNIPIFNSRIEDLKTHIEKVGNVKTSTKQDTIDVAKSNVETQMILRNKLFMGYLNFSFQRYKRKGFYEKIF